MPAAPSYSVNPGGTSQDRFTDRDRHSRRIVCDVSRFIPATSFEPLPSIPHIPPEAIEAAWEIVQWSIGQFSQVFPPPKPKPPKTSRVKERQLEETRLAKAHLHNHLRSSGSDTMAWSLAQELSWLSTHKFKTVVAHMKSMKEVEVLGGSDVILRFSSLFFAEMGYKKSIQSERWTV